MTEVETESLLTDHCFFDDGIQVTLCWFEDGTEN